MILPYPWISAINDPKITYIIIGGTNITWLNDLISENITSLYSHEESLPYP